MNSFSYTYGPVFYAAFSLCLGCGGGPAAPSATPSVEQAVVQHINDQRVSANLSPLARDQRLDVAAQWFADDKRGDTFDGVRNFDLQHRGSDGSTPGQRMKRFGYDAVWWVEEGISLPDGLSAQQTADWCYRAMMNASRAPLDSRYTDIGVGVSEQNVVCDFAVRAQ